jgi:PAS domain S-box-containing protein
MIDFGGFFKKKTSDDGTMPSAQDPHQPKQIVVLPPPPEAPKVEAPPETPTVPDAPVAVTPEPNLEKEELADVDTTPNSTTSSEAPVEHIIPVPQMDIKPAESVIPTPVTQVPVEHPPETPPAMVRTATAPLATAAAAVNQMKADLATAVANMERERARDEALLSSIGDAVVAVDENRRVTFINQAALNLLGYTAEEVIGKIYGRDVPQVVDEQGNQLPADQRSIGKAWSTRQKYYASYYYYTKKDGSKFPVGITAAPIITNDQITGAIVVFRDITKEKEIDRMKTEFISLASHQLRTPLSAIRWYVEMLIDGDAGELNPEQKEFAHNIQVSTDRMIELVTALLNISRIESGRIIIDPQPTNLGDLVREVTKEVELKLQTKKHHLIISVNDHLPLINLDPKLIRQVYLNLLTNAIKYTPEGGEISIMISKKDDQVVSQVSDSGYGIPEKEQHKVFQKFYRGQNVIKVETDGTGLGLYLVRAIIESSNGKIWFKSAEGKGTTFWFSIPLTGMAAKQGEVTLDS